jgi:hypothetical protein
VALSGPGAFGASCVILTFRLDISATALAYGHHATLHTLMESLQSLQSTIQVNHLCRETFVQVRMFVAVSA